MSQRLSDVDGFTIVYRYRRAARIHLLRAFPSCNVEERKAGRDPVRVEGSRESLLTVLKGKRAAACRRCFPDYAGEVDA